MKAYLTLAMAVVLTGCANGPADAPGPTAAAPPAPEAEQFKQDLQNPRLMAGLERRTIVAGGLTRTYFMHRPARLTGPAPVLFMLHGGASSAMRRAFQTGFNEIADREGFTAIYPQGANNGWNDGRTGEWVDRRTGDVDDVAFFAATVDRLVAEGVADPRRVYIVGGSNGGMMTYRLLCDIPEKITAAVAMVSNLPAEVQPRCRPSRPTPLMIMNGTADALMPFQGGRVAAAVGDMGQVISTPETVAFWRGVNGCAPQSTKARIPDRDPADGITTETETWSQCRGGAVVSFWRMDGGGHGLPGRSRNKSERAAQLGGQSTNDFDSSEEAWAFLRRFSR